MQTCADSRAEDIKVISHTKILLCCDKMQMSSKSPDTLALSSFLYAFFFFFFMMLGLQTAKMGQSCVLSI